jgi:hypothetical protein
MTAVIIIDLIMDRRDNDYMFSGLKGSKDNQ